MENQTLNKSCFLNLEKSSIADFETSDETTLSLPSLSVANNRLLADDSRVAADDRRRHDPKMTIRDSEQLVEELKRENFNLKLRIYCLEKSQNQNTFDANSETIQTFDEIKRLNNEFNQLSRDFDESRQLSLQLMSHLFQFCRLFRREDDDDNNDDDRRREQRLCRLLDASEDLLNCASILVTKRESGRHALEGTVGQKGREGGVSSAESDDIWSEPDRDASRARIGAIATTHTSPSASAGARHLRPRGKRRHSGGSGNQMSSSLALLDLDSKSAAVETSTQTQPLNDDKCVQTTTTTTTRDDNHNDLSLALSDVDDAFSQFDVRTRAKADAAGRQPRTTSGADSLFAYFASLSPMSRQKENKSQTKPKKEEFVPNIALSSHSSSVSSIVANRSDDLKAETSPDLGIADLRDERRVLVRVKHLKRLRRLLADAVTTSADPSVRRALAVTRECCESAERADDELSRLKRSKERMAREISKSLNKTEELLTKTELNLKLN